MCISNAPSAFAGIGSGLSFGPMLTTVLMLEPKEKETLAMPYVNNFVRMVCGFTACSDRTRAVAGALCRTKVAPTSSHSCAPMAASNSTQAARSAPIVRAQVASELLRQHGANAAFVIAVPQSAGARRRTV